MTIKFRIGDGQSITPAIGDSKWDYPCLKDQNFEVEKNGFGYLLEGYDFARLHSGGFVLLNSFVFSNGETFTITPY